MRSDVAAERWWLQPFDVAHSSLSDIEAHLRLSLDALSRTIHTPEILRAAHEYRKVRVQIRTSFDEDDEVSDGGGRELPENIEDDLSYQRAVEAAAYITEQRDKGFPVLMS